MWIVQLALRRPYTFIVGALLVGLTMADPRARPRGLRGWTVAVVVAIVNSLVLFAAALGIEKF